MFFLSVFSSLCFSLLCFIYPFSFCRSSLSFVFFLLCLFCLSFLSLSFLLRSSFFSLLPLCPSALAGRLPSAVCVWCRWRSQGETRRTPQSTHRETQKAPTHWQRHRGTHVHIHRQRHRGTHTQAETQRNTQKETQRGSPSTQSEAQRNTHTRSLRDSGNQVGNTVYWGHRHARESLGRIRKKEGYGYVEGAG